MHTKKFIAAVIGAFLLFGTNEASIINNDMKVVTANTKPAELHRTQVQTKPAVLVNPRPNIQTKPAVLVNPRPNIQTKPAVLVNRKPNIQTKPAIFKPQVQTKPAILVDSKPVEVTTKPILMVDQVPIKPVVSDQPKLPKQACKQAQQHANSKQLTSTDNSSKQAQKPKNKKPSTVDFDKKQWPQLKGLPASYAKLNISKTNPVLTVVIIKQGQPVTRDFNQNRVRIFVDTQQLVKSVPVRG